MFPRAIQGLRHENIAGPRLTNHHRIATVRKNKSCHVVAFASLIARPAETFVDVWPNHAFADGMHCEGSPPTSVAFGLVPATGKKMELPIRPLDDLPVPIAPLFHGDVLETVLRVAGEDIRCAPDVRYQWS